MTLISLEDLTAAVFFAIFQDSFIFSSQGLRLKMQTGGLKSAVIETEITVLNKHEFCEAGI